VVYNTEIGIVANYLPEYTKRNLKVMAFSVNGLKSHLNWTKDNEETQNVTVNYPISFDENKSVSHLCDMIDSNATFTVRSVIIIGSDIKIKVMLTNSASTGRNFDELLRVIDSLQLIAKFSVATPAN